MEDYPRDLTEFEARFANEAACRDYLFRLRWLDGFRCPRCGGSGAWPLLLFLRESAACRYQTSVSAGTIFQDTRKPLTLCFRAMWWVTSQKNGASALGMQRVLGRGWLAWIRSSGIQGICSPSDLSPRQEEIALGVDATSSSCGVAAETLAPRHSPRSGESRTSRLLPGRIHIQVQPADVPKSWQTLLPPCPAICRGGTSPLQSGCQRCETTTYSSHLSQVNTPFKPNLAMAFARRAVDSLGDAGTLAMITPNSLLEASSGSGVREALAEILTPQLIARLGDQSIFARALVDAGMYA